MPISIGRFLIDSGITSILSFSRQLPVGIHGTVELGNFTTVSGTHSLFIAVRVQEPSFTAGKQFSFSVQYDQTSNTWFKVLPLDETPPSGNDFDLDLKSDDIRTYLRLRRSVGASPATVHITIQNVGQEDSSFTPTSATGTDLPPVSFIASIPHGSIGTDHNTLTNRGNHPHSEIDDHLDAPSPHSGHENKSEKGQPSGYAGLDSSSKLDIDNIPVGSTPGTVCAGDDPRLVEQPPLAHAPTHSDGGSDALDLANLGGTLPQSRTHDLPDTDISPTSLHHTLGAGSNQAAPGDHLHSGNLRIAAFAALGSHRVVVVNEFGLLDYADRTVASHVGKVVGVTTTSVNVGELHTPQTHGEMELGSWNWTPGQSIILDTLGNLTQTISSSAFIQVIGFPISTTKMFINIQPPILG